MGSDKQSASRQASTQGGNGVIFFTPHTFWALPLFFFCTKICTQNDFFLKFSDYTYFGHVS